MHDIEALLLTGGASRRMGEDKAAILVEGEPLARRIARMIVERGIPVTVSGREPLEGYGFLPDKEEFAGPLAALAAFEPQAQFVFVVSCDLPGFDTAVIDQLATAIAGHEAAIPIRDGRLQPLCGLYRRSAFEAARERVAEDERRIMRWLERLDHVVATDIDPVWIANVNTPEDLRPFQAGE